MQVEFKMAKSTPPCELVAVEDILPYDDGEDKGDQTVRIRDYDSSAVKGRY